MAEYIEREALLELYDMGKELEEYAEVLSVPITVIRQNINDMPAADVAPVRHGRWLPCGFVNEIMCSVCGLELDDVWQYRHCPNCGALMDLEGGDGD